MTSIVTDFKSIRRKLERQEQKAEFDKENPEPSMYGWPYGVAVPLISLAHPEWPYTGTAHEWPKVKI
ncbi:hypothetical protein [Bradyrhizobium tunisiense]|uniref:hypothetical protein n=1 Tax=Bradyrhizobium tunisiense TaxID=3278709 RepID=UPI0035E38E2B